MSPFLTVALHTAAIYLFLIFMLRAFNRRQLGQLTVIDLVIIILLGSAVETAMVNANTTLVAGLISAGTLLILNRLFGLLFFRSKRLRHIVTCGPVLLVHDGQFVDERLKRAGLTRADVMEALREHEQADIANIRFAVLETDGSINVVPMQAKTYSSKQGKPKKPAS